jgi:hypothetical protein
MPVEVHNPHFKVQIYEIYFSFAIVVAADVYQSRLRGMVAYAYY